MNYLAHLLMARPTAGGYVGSLMPDMVSGRELRSLLAEPNTLGPELLEGITLHRLVDRLTDVHPGYFSARRRLFEDQGRYAGIVADVVFDHVLSRSWDRWAMHQPLTASASAVSLNTFLEAVESTLRDPLAQRLMPASMRIIVKRMMAGRWLHMYQELSELERVLWMMSQRFSARFGRTVELSTAIRVIEREYAGFEQDFEPLMRDLIEAVRQGAQK